MEPRAVGIRALFLILTSLGPSARAADPPALELLAEKCLGCHSPAVKKGGLDLSTRAVALRGGETGPALEPGQPDRSLLLDRVEAGEMPPSKPLDRQQSATLRAWIAAGAAYGDHPLESRRAGLDWWSLQPIRRPPLPQVRDRSWIRDPIDAFILARLESEGLSPAPEADRRSWIRRVSFDLTGLPPTPTEVDAFVSDPRADAHERVVDRLLGSPAFGERWGRHWLDVVRFAESHGYETNALRGNAWPYRDYVIRAINQDIPFARFVEDQLAGDVSPGADGLTRAATGFLVGGAHDIVGNQEPAQAARQRMDDLDDMITATGSAFLGLTVHCARCHDHKFDPIPQRDYYAIQAALAGVQHADREIPLRDPEATRLQAEKTLAELASVDLALDRLEPLAHPDLGQVGRGPVDPSRNVERIEPTRAHAVRFTILATADQIEPCLDELEAWSTTDPPRNVALAALGGQPRASSTYANDPSHRLEHLQDGRVGNGRSWISAVPGKGWAAVRFARPEVIDRVVWGRDREGKYRDRLAVAYTVELETEPGVWRVVASSADRAESGSKQVLPEAAELLASRDALRNRLRELTPTSRVYAGTFAQPGPTHRLARGDPLQPLETVAAGGLSSVGPSLSLPAEAPEAERRRALGRWLADPANPLPPRVMVNRLWHHHFGRGIAPSPSDLGWNGGQPSHPELLDWLAADFLAAGGQAKPIHRRIVLSAAYRQSSRTDPHAMAVDAESRLLWRFPPRRLEAEEIRDAILAVAGSLDRSMGGPGYTLWEPNTNYVTVFTPRTDLGPDTFRRMVYQFKPRSQQDPTFGAFDCPDGGLVAPRRTASTTPLQALNLLHGRFVLAQANRMALRLTQEAGSDPEAQCLRGFRLAFGREPNDQERSRATALIRDHGTAALARVLFNANEFLFVP